MNYTYYMEKAYKNAQEACKINEVPIGCVIVLNGIIIGSGYNRRNAERNALRHAEIIAIDEACKFLCDWRLEDASLFVTVEPCAMCAGAIVQARIKEVIFGTRNAKAGCGGSVLNILSEPRFNHKVEVIEGIMQEECSKLMSEFFSNLRRA